MTAVQEWALLLVGIVSPVLSFVGLVLGIRAQMKKANAEAHDVDASAADKLVDTALSLSEPLRIALENERKLYREELEKERRLRHDELEDEKNKRRALKIIVDQNSRELAELRADYAWVLEGATALSHQVKSLRGVPVFDVNEKRK